MQAFDHFLGETVAQCAKEQEMGVGGRGSEVGDDGIRLGFLLAVGQTSAWTKKQQEDTKNKGLVNHTPDITPETGWKLEKMRMRKVSIPGGFP